MAAGPDVLAVAFEEHRPHLRAVAGRLLGSGTDADDAVQETWLRLQGADVDAVVNLGGWLTTVVGRIALNTLRARENRRENPMDTVREPADGVDPEGEAVRADAVGGALIVVLDTLTPAERLAFVLHDLFGLPFEEIAPIVERSPAAARQLASRARRRVRGADPDDPASGGDTARRREVVGAFLAAARDGDFAGLLAVLDPEVVLRADDAAVTAATAARGYGAPELAPEVRGADAVARVFCGRASAACAAVIDGSIGAAYAVDGRARSAFRMVLEGDRVVGIEVVADPAELAALDLVLLA